MARTVRMKWPTLSAEVSMELEERNPELAEEFWSHLDFETIQDHGVVTGKIMYCWAPMVSLAPVRFADWHSKAPFGRVFYSQGTGNKVIVNYGKATEDIDAPVLGHIRGDVHDVLERVGQAAWQSVYTTKELIAVRYARAGG